MTKLFLWTFFVLIVFTGCVTQEKCNSKFPPSVTHRDSVHVKDSVAITYVPVLIPKDSIIYHDSVPCADFYLDINRKERNLTASLHIEKGKVTFKCLEDSLRAEIEKINHFNETLKQELYDSKSAPVKEYIKHWWNPYADWFALIVHVLIIVVLALRWKKLLPFMAIMIMFSITACQDNNQNARLSPPRPPAKPCCWPPPCKCDTIKK